MTTTGAQDAQAAQAAKEAKEAKEAKDPLTTKAEAAGWTTVTAKPGETVVLECPHCGARLGVASVESPIPPHDCPAKAAEAKAKAAKDEAKAKDVKDVKDPGHGVAGAR